MSNDSNWREDIKTRINTCMDWFYEFFADADAEYDHISPNNDEIDIEIQLTIKAKKNKIKR